MKLVGKLVQVPFVAVNVKEFVAVPVTVGATVLAGRARATIAVVDADHFVADPPGLVPVTDATINLAASAETNV